MRPTFKRLPKEKKEIIIRSAVEEFSTHGYEKGSTNNIVKKSGVSKGSLFKYCGNKKELYLYTLDCVIDYYIGYIESEVDKSITDIFDKILEYSRVKAKICDEKPMVYKFIASAFISLPEDIVVDINSRYEKLMEISNDIMYRDLDYSKFRDDIDKEKAVEVIISSLIGLYEKIVKEINLKEDKGYSNRDEIFNAFNEYVDILRKVFYK